MLWGTVVELVDLMIELLTETALELPVVAPRSGCDAGCWAGCGIGTCAVTPKRESFQHTVAESDCFLPVCGARREGGRDGERGRDVHMHRETG